MSQEQQQRFRELLFADALRAREEIAFGDDTVTVQRPSFWTRLLRRRPTNTFTPLDTTDPRHPCYVEGGVAGVNRKVRFDEVYVSEPEQNSLRNQFAVLHCYPAWEDEHGVSIIIRNGIPIALTGEYEPSLAQYDDI